MALEGTHAGDHRSPSGWLTSPTATETGVGQRIYLRSLTLVVVRGGRSSPAHLPAPTPVR